MASIPVPGFLAGGSELGKLIAAYDWARTPLGPIEHWPTSLSTTIGLILRSPIPIVTLWGDAGTMIYNDAYSEFAGGRHPQLLGSPVREGWGEISDFNDNVMKVGLAGGTLSYTDQELTLHRSGHPEQVFMNLDYSPVIGEAGKPIGVIAIVVETTRQVMLQRELAREVAQRRAEQEAQQKLFEQAPGFIVIMRGPDHLVEFVNDAHRKVFNSGDWPGRSMREAFPSIDGQGFFEALDDVYTTGRTLEFTSTPVEFQTTPEGPRELHHLTFIYAPLFGDDGKVTGVFCEGFDVTGAHIAQRRATALASLSDRIREISDPGELVYAAARILGEELGTSRAGYGTIDPVAETVTIANDWMRGDIPSIAGTLSFREFGSYIDDLLAGRPSIVVDTFIDPRTSGTAHMLTAIQTRSFVNMPVMEQGRLVAVFYVNDDKARVFTLDELGFLNDVAARTRTAVQRLAAEASVRDNEARLRFLDELGRQTARSTDADEILAITTSLLGQQLGVSICAYADMEADGDHFTIRDDWHAEGSQSIRGYYSLAAFGRLAVARLHAGEPLIINDNLAELDPAEAATFQSIGIGATICMPLVKEGRLTALMAIHHRLAHRWTPADLSLLREVTERSWAHIARVRAEGELENRLAERTAELAEAGEKLHQAQKMEAIGNLTGGVAHDFNNLLSAVLGSLELLRKRMPDDPPLLRLVDNAMEGAQRGSSLTRRMLAFARRQDLQAVTLSPAELVGGMEELMQRALGPTVIVETAFPPLLPRITADPNQLESAILNLAVNARDAMHGEGRIAIAGREEHVGAGHAVLAPGRYVVLSVRDEGEGMDEATLQRATEPFFTTKGVGKGTGLGLSMVYGLAEQSGGTLVLNSEIGVGTTAEIWLPAIDADDEAAPPPVEESAAPHPHGRTIRVLAVDDDALVLMNTVAMLEDMGHRVTEAYSAQAALAELERDDFDLVITDHAMPQMTGAQLAREIAQRWPKIRVVLATGYAELPSGDDPGLPRLSKPFMQADLSGVIASVMQG